MPVWAAKPAIRNVDDGRGMHEAATKRKPDLPWNESAAHPHLLYQSQRLITGHGWWELLLTWESLESGLASGQPTKNWLNMSVTEEN